MTGWAPFTHSYEYKTVQAKKRVSHEFISRVLSVSNFAFCLMQQSKASRFPPTAQGNVRQSVVSCLAFKILGIVKLTAFMSVC